MEIKRGAISFTNLYDGVLITSSNGLKDRKLLIASLYLLAWQCQPGKATNRRIILLIKSGRHYLSLKVH